LRELKSLYLIEIKVTTNAIIFLMNVISNLHSPKIKLMTKIILKSKKDLPVKRFHPWVFSGAVHEIVGEVKDGDVVEVYSKGGAYLATGHYQDASIKVRLFSRQKELPTIDFWIKKIQTALAYRKQIQLPNQDLTNCFRLIHATGDGLPGLIIDMYGKTAVLQCHSIGMHLESPKIVAALKEVFGEELEAIYDKSVESLPSDYASNIENQYLFGKSSDDLVLENGLKFKIDWEKGQKTGFFLDQRDNRQLLSKFVKGKSVLNTFCYTGGFSVYALNAGASLVHSVDLSKNAIDLANQNVALNGFQKEKHKASAIDVLKFLQENKTVYDVMVVDPPAYAKNPKKRHNAIQGYKRLNALAMKKIAKGGILFTFSCSKVVDKTLFYNTIVAAAIEAKRQVKVMYHLTQPADHPVNLFHEQGAYLKGLVLYVE
jgi:23S rRNA (cytosine1962-C5)-methyltransferase